MRPFLSTALNRVYSLILILALAAPFIFKNVVLVSFYIHQDYIASELCVEKDVEGSCCKGSCVLQKELQKTDAGKDQLPQQLKERTEIVFVIAEDGKASSGYVDPKLIHTSNHHNSMSEQHTPELVHPPSSIG